ncbi:MAG: peptide chain release factor-like protein [Victivallales bacterium]|nr:peptide chain release factor-like protein [Victivallales bacterium]MCF7888491.1 peptide chain release factor-like protein [Victivallales bacterium]
MSYFEGRNKLLSASDVDILKNCRVDWYQSRGPGGQKKNRKFSAVRVHHIPTGVTVEETGGRSQNLNKHNAIKKLKLKIAVKTEDEEIDFFRPDCSVKNDKFPLCAAKVFDHLKRNVFSIRATADSLDISTSKLIKFLCRDLFLWREINDLRERKGMKRLKLMN